MSFCIFLPGSNQRQAQTNIPANSTEKGASAPFDAVDIGMINEIDAFVHVGLSVRTVLDSFRSFFIPDTFFV